MHHNPFEPNRARLRRLSLLQPKAVLCGAALLLTLVACGDDGSAAHPSKDASVAVVTDAGDSADAVVADADAGGGGSGDRPSSDAGIDSAGDGDAGVGAVQECKRGFAFDSTSDKCVDVDECANDGGGCDTNATCSDNKTPAKPPTCACNEGFAGDGKHCDLRFRAVVTGGQHACGLAGDGSLYCWGSNSDGQLGIGNAQVGTMPVGPTRVGSDSDWDEVALGATSTCGIRAGKLYCWGSDRRGQLGQGGTLANKHRALPVAVVGEHWFGLSAAGSAVCGLNGSGGTGYLYCFGEMAGSDAVETVPVPVGDTATKWRAVSTSGSHTCGIRDDGALFCWGDTNSSGLLGLGDAAVGSDPIAAPTRVGDAVDWVAIEVGAAATCGLRKSGELWCWGASYYLPNGGSDVASPVRQGVWDDWHTLTLADGSSLFGCGVRAQGELWCWGWNRSGQQGEEPKASTLAVELHRVGSDADWSDVSAGSETVCGVRDGRAHCWGSNQAGKLGTLSELRYVVRSPERVGDSSDWSAVSAGESATCGLRGGNLYCWGPRFDDDSLASMPRQVGSDDGWTQVSTGYGGGALGLRDSSVYRWGRQEGGAAPALDDTVAGWSSIAISRGAFGLAWSTTSRCGIRSGSLYCWGKNYYGVLGVGDDEDRDAPAPVSGNWLSITVGANHSCAISNAGEMHCWGRAEEIGVNASGDALSPARVGIDSDWTAVSAGGTHTCAIRDGAMYCWEGALPEQVGSDTDWKAVSAWSGQCGLRGAALYCWGNNASGQLGLPAEDELVENPTLVDDGTQSSWQQVSMGANHACGIRGDGSLWCWGGNEVGQTGIEPSWATVPREIRVR